MIDLMPDDYKKVYLINQQKWITEDEYEKEKPDSYNFYEKGEYIDENLIVFMMPTIRDGTKKYNNAVFISEFVNVKNEIIIMNMMKMMKDLLKLESSLQKCYQKITLESML